MGRIFVGLGFLVLATFGAQGASFDCAKAGSALEHAVCADAELSQLDEKIATAYAGVLEGLSASAQDQVRAGQKSWLAYAARACTDDGVPLKGAYDTDGVGCLTGLYRDRLDRLDARFSAGGLRFYPVDLYGVLPDPMAASDSWNKIATKELLSLRLDGFDPLAQKFNAFMDKIDQPVRKDMPGVAGADPDGTSDLWTRIDLASVLSTRISLSEADSFYGHGAAHPNYYKIYHHYLRAQNRPMRADDLFADPPGFAKKLTPRVIAILKASYGADVIWTDLEGLDKTIGDPEHWDFLPEGLGIQFEPYEVTAYAYGAPVLVVPWATVSEAFTPTAWSLIAD